MTNTTVFSSVLLVVTSPYFRRVVLADIFFQMEKRITSKIDNTESCHLMADSFLNISEICSPGKDA